MVQTPLTLGRGSGSQSATPSRGQATETLRYCAASPWGCFVLCFKSHHVHKGPSVPPTSNERKKRKAITAAPALTMRSHLSNAGALGTRKVGPAGYDVQQVGHGQCISTMVYRDGTPSQDKEMGRTGENKIRPNRKQKSPGSAEAHTGAQSSGLKPKA